MWALFFTVAIVHIGALASPGPDFFFVSQTAVSRSRRDAIIGVAGITLGVVVWAMVALMGLHLLLQKMAWLQQAISLCGGIYLCWMGWRLLSSALKKRNAEQDVAVLSSNPHTFWRGLLTNLSNPKAVIYFGSIFSLVVGDGVSATARSGLLVMITLETFVWFSLVALVFALPRVRQGYQRMVKTIDGITGALFAGIGIHFILSR
jgi:threonine efflux protein